MTIGINASFLRKSDTGIGQVTFNFIRKLIELNVEDVRFVLYVEEESGLELPRNFEERVFLPRLYKRDDLARKIMWEKKLLPREVRRDGCDVFLSLYQSATVFKKDNKRMDSRLRGNDSSKFFVKHLMLVHDTVWKIFPEYLNNWRKKRYYKAVEEGIIKADKILTVSENSKKDIVKFFGINENKIDVHYVDCSPIFKDNLEKVELDSRLREDDIQSGDKKRDDIQKDDKNKDEDKDKNKKEDSRYIFYVGGFDIRKNVDRLFEAYGMLWKKWEKDKNSFPRLVLAGNFHAHLVPLVTNLPLRIKEISKKYGLPEENIKQIGFVEQKDLPDWYRNAELFCYPTLYEGFGLPVLEAQNCGCPVITSNVSSVLEVASVDNAILVNPESTEEIAGAMFNCLTSEGLRDRLISEGKKNAMRFSWDNFARKVLIEVLKEGSAGL